MGELDSFWGVGLESGWDGMHSKGCRGAVVGLGWVIGGGSAGFKLTARPATSVCLLWSVTLREEPMAAEPGGREPQERSGPLGIARLVALILHVLPSIWVHTQEIPSAWFSLKVDLRFCFFSLLPNLSPLLSSYSTLQWNTCACYLCCSHLSKCQTETSPPIAFAMC